ncbi:hypothetical protein EV683_1173 [Crenobacter luteus]|uniref:HGGxSTG domain-containing protein n=1 Tax=Crenobacter luteus TaxID=1452487 RepID=UPI001046265A|nr:HGGxSTG domain-containing protein [Crenobacter luteus]TCP10886.1 hypothetical protein EV683_1173 [Crenobacter luteus]
MSNVIDFAPPPCPVCEREDGTHSPLSRRNGCCKLHGGASTGPRTAEGKARVTANLGDFAKTTP